MKWWQLIIFAGVFLLVVLAAVWLPNWRLLWLLPSWELLGTTFASFQSNFSPFSRIVVIIIALETGVYVSLLAALFSRPGASFFGVLLGLLGLGCASCGSVVLTSLLGLATATAFLSFFPWAGKELGISAIILLAWAIWSLVRKSRADSCKINV